MAVLLHGHTSETYAQVFTNLMGANVLSTVNISNAAHTQLTVSTVKASGLGWTVRTFAYSYDGVIHTDSYISDI